MSGRQAKAQRAEVQRAGTQQVAARTHTEINYQIERSGPLPLPVELEGYERVCPGAAERILAMAESNAKSRQRNDQLIIETEARDRTVVREAERRGQYLGFVICLFMLACIAWCAHVRANAAAGGLSFAMVGIVVAFTLRRPSRTTDDADKEA